jgi:3'(2'), 5'-bisphosphate nucleotidase
VNDIAALLPNVTAIAEDAGRAILDIYRDESRTAERQKDDASPVTAADEAADALILSALGSLTPEIPIITEESFAPDRLPDLSGGLFWLVDPLDGTKEFLSRNGEFTVNIALIESGLPVLGVVHAPALDRTWTGAGPGSAAFRDQGADAVSVRVRSAQMNAITVIASRRHGSGGELDHFLSRFKVAERVSAGSSLKFCLIASGQADLYPRFGRTMEWDTAAGHAVLLAAGGRVERSDGAAFVYGKAGFENPAFVAYGGL